MHPVENQILDPIALRRRFEYWASELNRMQRRVEGREMWTLERGRRFSEYDPNATYTNRGGPKMVYPTSPTNTSDTIIVPSIALNAWTPVAIPATNQAYAAGATMAEWEVGLANDGGGTLTVDGTGTGGLNAFFIAGTGSTDRHEPFGTPSTNTTWGNDEWMFAPVVLTCRGTAEFQYYAGGTFIGTGGILSMRLVRYWV